MLFGILFNQNLTAKQAVIIFVIAVCAYLISIGIHEFAHAFVAYKQGDNTAKAMGRLSLNPFKHVDLMGTLSFMVLGIGWAKPVPVNPLNFKKYKTGMRQVSLAGVIANFILGLLCAVIYAIIIANVSAISVPLEYLLLVLEYFMLVNSFLIMFNLLPIYPFDGFNFITTFMKSDNGFIKGSLKNGWKILLAILIVTSLIDLMFGIDILSYYLSIMFRFIFRPICLIGI